MKESSKERARLGYVASALLLVASALLLPLSGVSAASGHTAKLIYTHRVSGEPVVNLTQGRRFEFRVKNGHRGIVSSKGFAKGAAAPRVTSQPSSISVTAGQTASFRATASGSPSPRVQWRLKPALGSTFTAISGATSTTYSLVAHLAQSGNSYEAVFTNAYGTATSHAATLTVTPAPLAPTVTAQPSPVSVNVGSVASFSAAASGTPTPTVQWMVSSDAGSIYSSIGGATSTTYSFTAQSGQNGYLYEAVFANTAGSATSTPASLTVTTAPIAPIITTQPTSVTIAAGSTATFSAAASGSPVPTIQWSYSTNGTTWTPTSGATSTSYSLTVNSGENGYRYEAVFANSAGSATTTPAMLTVTTAPNASSSNWSGYADYGTTFTGVSGSWTVPTLTCSGNATTYSSHWIGIDGAASGTVEQDGTEADCVGATPVYDAWYEMYGDAQVNHGYEVQLGTGSNPVAAGDPMSAHVSVANDVWTLSISDGSASHGWTFSTTVTFAASSSSAEWVVERPEICSSTCSLTSLANFGSVTFTTASATTSAGSFPISAFSYYDIEMVNGSTVDALPSGLSANGTSFTDTWLHA